MRALLFAFLLLLGAAFCRPCRADPSEPAADSVARAEQLFHEGTKAFEAAEYAEAYTALKSAWELAPSYRTAAGLGQVELQIERFRDAAYYLSYCLRHYPQDADAGIRAHVEEGLEQARTHVAALRVRVGVEGAEVAIDGASVGKSPLDGLVFVEPGSHKVTASHPGYRLAEVNVETPVRATRDVSLSLVSDENGSLPRVSGVSLVETPPGDTLHPTSPSGLSATSWVLIVGGSLTAAALATTIVFAVKGAAASDDLKAAQVDVPPSRDPMMGACSTPSGSATSACARVHDLADTRNTDNQIAILGAIVTGALAAATAGTAVYVHSKEHTERAATGRPFVRVAAGLSGGSVLLGAAF